jgi:N-acetylmuramoyl-L-alanine amidase
MTDVSLWVPEFPEGRIERIYLHWSAGDYESVFPAYHYCVTFIDGRPGIVQTNDLRANMRDVREAPDLPYAAHTAGRNSYAAGISVMGMQDARPDDFGPYPLVDAAVEALCRVAGSIAAFYDIPVDAGHVLTHAEAALIDGYFGTAAQERWDIARLAPSPQPLAPDDARRTGEELRRRIGRFRS